MLADHIPGYNYGSPGVAKSPISEVEFELLKQSAGFTKEDERWLRTAGEVLADQTKDLIGKWREAIAAHPYLAKYSQRPDGQKDPRYSEDSGLRFQQWVLDTCLRPYDQDWLDYQQEIALRHTTVKKNKTDSVQSAPAVHLRHIIAFAAAVNDPTIIKPFLAKKVTMQAKWRRCTKPGRNPFGCRLPYGRSPILIPSSRQMSGEWPLLGRGESEFAERNPRRRSQSRRFGPSTFFLPGEDGFELDDLVSLARGFFQSRAVEHFHFDSKA